MSRYTALKRKLPDILSLFSIDEFHLHKLLARVSRRTDRRICDIPTMQPRDDCLSSNLGAERKSKSCCEIHVHNATTGTILSQFDASAISVWNSEVKCHQLNSPSTNRARHIRRKFHGNVIILPYFEQSTQIFVWPSSEPCRPVVPLSYWIKHYLSSDRCLFSS